MADLSQYLQPSPAGQQQTSDPTEIERRKQGWKQALTELKNNPDALMFLFNLGQGFSQPGTVDQRISGGLQRGVGYLGAAAQQRANMATAQREASLSEREQARKEADTAARIAGRGGYAPSGSSMQDRTAENMKRLYDTVRGIVGQPPSRADFFQGPEGDQAYQEASARYAKSFDLHTRTLAPQFGLGEEYARGQTSTPSSASTSGVPSFEEYAANVRAANPGKESMLTDDVLRNAYASSFGGGQTAPSAVPSTETPSPSTPPSVATTPDLTSSVSFKDAENYYKEINGVKLSVEGRWLATPNEQPPSDPKRAAILARRLMRAIPSLPLEEQQRAQTILDWLKSGR